MIEFTIMANRYNSIKLAFSEGGILRIRGYYEFKKSSCVHKKVLYLTYKVLDAPSELNLEDFTVDFIDQVLTNGFLKVQSAAVCWTKLVIADGSQTFNYHLPGTVKGVLEDSLPSGAAAYEFEFQSSNNRSTFLNLYGVPSRASYSSISVCEKVLLEPLILDKAKLTLQLSGIRAQNSHILLSIIGRGFTNSKRPTTSKRAVSKSNNRSGTAKPKRSKLKPKSK